MYRQSETQETAILQSGVEIRPVATLKDPYGGIVHVWIDDHCYQIGIEGGGITRPTTYIFREAHQLLSELPPPGERALQDQEVNGEA